MLDRGPMLDQQSILERSVAPSLGGEIGTVFAPERVITI